MSNSARKVFVLRTQKLFVGVSDEVLANVKMRFATFALGKAIVHHGQENPPLVLLVSGQAQRSRYSEDGREVGLGFVRPGESFGEAAILLDTPAMATLTAVTSTLVGLVDRAEARTLFSDVASSIHLAQVMASKLERVIDTQAMITLPNSHARIYAAILSALAEDADGDKPHAEFPALSAIALAANVSRETVSRAIRTLIARGAIAKVNHRRFRLVDRQVLQELVAAS